MTGGTVVTGGIGDAVGTGTTDELLPACVAEVEVVGEIDLLEGGPLGEDVLGVLEELFIVVVKLEGARDVGLTGGEVGVDAFFVEDGTILDEFIVGTAVGVRLLGGSETAAVILA